MLSNGISAAGLQCSQDSISCSALRRVAPSMRTTFCCSGTGSTKSRGILLTQRLHTQQQEKPQVVAIVMDTAKPRYFDFVAKKAIGPGFRWCVNNRERSDSKIGGT